MKPGFIFVSEIGKVCPEFAVDQIDKSLKHLLVEDAKFIRL